MDPILKQRLVGALVLVALGVVFWPIIFVQPERDAASPVALEPIPPRPEIDLGNLPEPENRRDTVAGQLPVLPVQDRQQSAADESTMLNDTSDLLERDTDALPSASSLDPPNPRDTAPEQPLMDDQGLAMAWVLQVATLSSRERAQRLVDKLSSRGYTAFISATSQSGKSLFRVQIGPKLEQAKLEPIKAVIDPLLDVNSAVIRYVQ